MTSAVVELAYIQNLGSIAGMGGLLETLGYGGLLEALGFRN